MISCQLRPLLYSKKARVWLAALAAFIGYGAWAFYANHSYPFAISLKAAMTQGSYSFMLTLTLSWGMEWLHQTLGANMGRLPLTVILTCLFLYATSWGINALLGTPEIFLTILPGAIIGTIYTFSYGLALEQLIRKTSQ